MTSSDRPSTTRRLPRWTAWPLAWSTCAFVLALALVGTLARGPGLGALSWILVILTLVALGLGAGAWIAYDRADARRRDLESAVTRLGALLSQQPLLTLMLKADGAVTAAYGTAPQVLPAEALMADGILAQVHAPDRPLVMAALDRAVALGGAEVGFTPRRALDRHVVLVLSRLDDGAAGEGRLAGSLRDATVQQAREAALEHARSDAEQLNAGKSRFLANMSHELRTPLNAVIGFSDIMRQQLFGPLQEKYLEYARLIHESGGHLLDLINDVLDMSKIEADRYELSRDLFDARDPVSASIRLVRLQAHDRGVDLRAILPAGPMEVDADQRALKQIALNLLSNALKFTPTGGSVTLTLQAAEGAMELSVADTGVGVSPEDLLRLGRPFEQAGDATSRARGTGLGLSLVRALAELHGGTLSLESTLGEGTAATIRLPVLVESRRPPVPEGGAQVLSIRRG